MTVTNKAVPTLGEGVFTVRDISQILKIAPRKVSHIANYYIKGKFALGLNFNYNLSTRYNVFNFKSLVEIKIFHLWKSEGVPLKAILEAHDDLAKKYDTKYPLALNNLAIAGKEVVEIISENFYVKAGGSDQIYLSIVKEFLKKVEYDKDGMASRLYPLGKEGSVVVDPKIQFGQPVIRGTRITIENITSLYEAGDSVYFISKLYNLNLQDVKKSIAFYKSAA